MISVKTVSKEAFHPQNEMAKILRAIYEIIDFLKKMNRYGCSLFQIETT